ncbi:serine/threonine-protein kinase [Actinocorallia sp. B10E7]|uniref:serine/threonine-protein kinase n=1 Tax=Actinocorallia sp. B10E7 TaxID=3153558 RepID=UPI00325C6F0F
MQAPLPDGPHQVGPYRVLALLGQGGMGRVLLAAGPDGRLVAVKQVLGELAEDTGFRARFRREVAASRRVSGARTAPVVDADPEAPSPWLASVFVPGPSLDHVLRTVGPLPEDAVRRLAAGLAQALLDVHGAGLVHRDLKPANVLLADDGPRVIDFGIARALDGGDTELTGTGALIGSPSFMAPEQALGREATPASDVFSLGVTLAAACTGRTPFEGRSAPQVLYNVVHADPDLTELPPALREIVEPCLAKDPAARPSPAQLLERIGGITPTTRPWPLEVHRLTAGRQAEISRLLSAAPVTFPVSSPAAPRRRRRAGLVSVAVLAAVGLLGVTAFALTRPDGPPGAALARVADRYTENIPSCEKADPALKVPSGFEAPLGYEDERYESDTRPHTNSRCIWQSRSGDRIDLSWMLFRTGDGPGSGAQKAKDHFEEFYDGAGIKRESALGFAEEGMWAEPSGSGPRCVLWVRDVNLVIFILLEGLTYPSGRCEPAALAVAEEAMRAVRPR